MGTVHVTNSQECPHKVSMLLDTTKTFQNTMAVDEIATPLDDFGPVLGAHQGPIWHEPSCCGQTTPRAAMVTSPSENER